MLVVSPYTRPSARFAGSVWYFHRVAAAEHAVVFTSQTHPSSLPHSHLCAVAPACCSMPRGRAGATSTSPRHPNPPSGPSGRIELSALRRVAPSPQRGRFETGGLQKRTNTTGQASPAASASAGGSEQLGGKLDSVKQRLLNIESRLASIEERLGDL